MISEKNIPVFYNRKTKKEFIRDFVVDANNQIAQFRSLIIPLSIAQKEYLKGAREDMVLHLLKCEWYIERMKIVNFAKILKERQFPDAKNEKLGLQIFLGQSAPSFIEIQNEELDDWSYTRLPYYLLKKFVEEGLKACISFYKAHTLIQKDPSKRLINLKEVAEVSSGKSWPAKDHDEHTSKREYISAPFLQKHSFITPKVPLEVSTFKKSGKGSIEQIKDLKDCILSASVVYGPGKIGKSLSLIDGQVSTRVTTAVSILKPSPYVSKQYFRYLFTFLCDEANLKEQLVYFTSRTINITGKDLENILVISPESINQDTLDRSEKKYFKMVEMVNSNPQKDYSFESLAKILHN
ncbi:MAG: hypothetical protein HQK83_07120 [Fibrobacteria bacterium]|nr:hypothetical protein [Fibrobacteria bacterium]